MRFAQFQAGMSIDGGRRIVTEAEIIEFARRYDPQWFHTDPARAAEIEAVGAQGGHLAPDGGHVAEEVAGVGVTGHQAQRASLP